MRIFVYPWDLVDEGVENVLERIKSWGSDSIAVAVNYHEAKLFLPHNPKRKVYFPEEGAVYYPVNKARHQNKHLRPYESEFVKENPIFWNRIASACKKEGLSLVAWVVCLHNSHYGKDSRLCLRNVYGDAYSFSLCPAHPGVREYIKGLVEDVSNLPGVDQIFLEALHYMDFEHGYHHEMTGANLSEKVKSLLGLCFCEACENHFLTRGMDLKSIKEFVVSEIERELIHSENQEGEMIEKWMIEQGLGDIMKIRSEIVTSLIHEIHISVQTPLIYFTPGPEHAWSNGIDLSRTKNHVSQFEMYHYDRSLEHLAVRIERMKEMIGKTPFRIILRAGFPDVLSASELVDRVNHIKRLPVQDFSLYNYGQVPLHYWEALGKK